MISRERLKEHAKRKGFTLGQAQVDYYQDIVLFILYREFGRELIFKGGTALAKCFGFDRFSEDLDFNLDADRDVKEVLSHGLTSFYIGHEIHEERFKNSRRITLRIEGPLYNGNRISLCKIILDLSYRETVMREPLLRRIGLTIDEIPTYDVVVMDRTEILAEKIRSICTRTSARDVYDAYYLLHMVSADHALIRAKMAYYDREWREEPLGEKVEEKRGIWDSEMRNLTRRYPDFDEAQQFIIAHVQPR